MRACVEQRTYTALPRPPTLATSSALQVVNRKPGKYEADLTRPTTKPAHCGQHNACDHSGGSRRSRPSLSIVVVSRPSTSSATTHWAIAVVTDERSRRCRVFHVSDAHILGLRALGWSAFAQDETLDRSSRYRGGVRIGFVESDDLCRLEQVRAVQTQPSPPASLVAQQAFVVLVLVARTSASATKQAICGSPLPPPTSDTGAWDCTDWTLAILKRLEDQGFVLVTYGLDDGALIGQLARDSLRAQRQTERHGVRPVFVPLSLPRTAH